ncbi:PEP-CTERM sorting domain-containing protein [Haloferula sargassicola]
MKPPHRMTRILPAILAPLCFSTGHAATVFADDFSEPDGTTIIGKAPDVGSAWTGTAPTISAGTFDTTGAGRAAFANFSVALGAGQVLTLTYDTLLPAGGAFFTGGYAGVSLYAGGSEQVFTGDLGIDTFWGVDQPAVGGAHASTDNTAATTATLTYFFDTGAWSFTTLSGANLSGTGVSGVAFDQLRIANGNGGDIRVDNLMVDISAVPEPSAALLLGLSAAGIGLRRRRA